MDSKTLESPFATRIKNLGLVNLPCGNEDPTNIRTRQRYVFETLRKRLDYDYILIDLGSEKDRPLLELARVVDKKILVTTPEPPSIANTYRLMEALVGVEKQGHENIDKKGDRIKLVMNFVRAKTDIDIGKTMINLCRKHWRCNIDFVGYMSYQDSIAESVRRRSPFMLSETTSSAQVSLKRIAANIKNNYRFLF